MKKIIATALCLTISAPCLLWADMTDTTLNTITDLRVLYMNIDANTTITTDHAKHLKEPKQLQQ